jgi:hypothetical protein
MTDRAIVSGVLFRAPATKTSKAGKAFVFATIRSGSGEAARWWKCFVFSESAIEEISQLDDGAPIAVAGEFDCELYSPAGGESRLGWKIVADAVLSGNKPKPKAQPKLPLAAEAASAPTLLDRERRAPIDDDIPF